LSCSVHVGTHQCTCVYDGLWVYVHIVEAGYVWTWTVDATFRRFSNVLFHDQCGLCVKFYLGASIYYISKHLICSQPSFSGISSLPLPFSASLHFNVDSHIYASELKRSLFSIICCWRLVGVVCKLFVKIYNFSHLVGRCHPSQHCHQLPAGATDFLFLRKAQTGSGPTENPIQCTPGVSFLGLKRPGCECHSSSECGVENKNG